MTNHRLNEQEDFAPTHVKSAVLQFAKMHGTHVVELGLKQYYLTKTKAKSKKDEKKTKKIASSTSERSLARTTVAAKVGILLERSCRR